MADSIEVAGESRLANAIAEAEKTLNDAFGSGEALSGEGAFRFLNLDTLISAYRSEAQNINVVVENFLEISKSIKKMRSSFLPIDFFKDTITGDFSSVIANTVAAQESYENAFMRMLGMPSSDDIRIQSAQDLSFVDKFGTITELASYETVEREILNERNRERDKRSVVINNSIYNINNLSPEFIDILKQAEEETDLSAVLAGDMTTTNDEVERFLLEARITNMESDIFKFSYLLLPAIQDHRVSGCISETEKLVASPFSPVRGRTVNGSTVRPSLLESVIRIRLDRLTGTDTFVNASVDDGEATVSLTVGQDELPVDSNSYGILEALFILRLRAAIGGLGRRLAEDIDDFIEISESIRMIPSSTNSSNASGQNVLKEQDDLADTSVDSSIDNSDVEIGEGVELLENQLLIEDAIMSLLGDNGEVLDLQTQTQRNSSVHNAHLMSGLIGVIDVPRKRIEKELAEKAEIRVQQMDIEGGAATTCINTVLGVSYGVGTIDVAVFCLALFSMSEPSLLGLLSSQDYDHLLKNDYSSLPSSVVSQNDIVVSLNEFTSLVMAGYKEFERELTSQDQDI